MQITKENLKDFRAHMQRAAEEFGVQLEIGRITFTDSTAKFSANIYAEGGKADEFAKGARKFGFPAEWYGRTFFDDEGERHTIVGVNLRARTYPIETTGDGGRRMKWSKSGVMSHLGA